MGLVLFSMRFLMFLTPCAIAGYMVYPYLNEINFLSSGRESVDGTPKQTPEQIRFAKHNLTLLESISEDDIVGSWVLNPHSSGIASNSVGTRSSRSGMSLESWGGGEANFILKGNPIKGPISWHSKTGSAHSPATLHITSANQKFVLRFTRTRGQIELLAEADSTSTNTDGFLRFLKAR